MSRLIKFSDARTWVGIGLLLVGGVLTAVWMNAEPPPEAEAELKPPVARPSTVPSAATSEVNSTSGRGVVPAGKVSPGLMGSPHRKMRSKNAKLQKALDRMKRTRSRHSGKAKVPQPVDPSAPGR